MEKDIKKMTFSEQNKMLKEMENNKDICGLFELADMTNNNIIRYRANQFINSKINNIVIETTDMGIKIGDELMISCLDERAVLYDQTENVTLGAYNDENRNYTIYTAYFKYFNSKVYASATKLARITILNPTYIIGHKNSGTKAEEWFLKSGERKYLDKLMHSTTKNGKNVWLAVCEEFNIETGLNLNFGTQIPDFREIKRGK